MRREHIKFGLVRNEIEFQSLAAFAATFNHHIGPDSIMPIYTIERGQQMLGYFNVLTYPIVAPALHPSLTTPRDFYEVIQILKNHFCLTSISEKFPNGTGFMAVPTDGIVEDSVFERSGFRNTKKEIWQAIP
jgi:hypothetical protein